MRYLSKFPHISALVNFAVFYHISLLQKALQFVKEKNSTTFATQLSPLLHLNFSPKPRCKYTNRAKL